MSVDLRVDWCDYKAAKFAVEHWHYSRTMPSPYSKPVKLGIWEDGEFTGVIIFTTGVRASLAMPYGLKNGEVCELQRVALKSHIAPVSKMISVAIAKLSRANPGLRLIISFADPYQDHHGGIYQAGNWIYTGETSPSMTFIDSSGRYRHPRNVRAKSGHDQYGVKMYGIADLKREDRPGKHRYLYPLDRAMRKQIAPLAKPYPKRETCGQSVEGDTSGDQPEEAGSIPAARSDLG